MGNGNSVIGEIFDSVPTGEGIPGPVPPCGGMVPSEDSLESDETQTYVNIDIEVSHRSGAVVTVGYEGEVTDDVVDLVRRLMEVVHG